MTREEHQKLAELQAAQGAKYKILVYDGRYIDTVLYDRYVFRELPKLLDHGTTMESLLKKPKYYEPWHSQYKKLLRKCELVDVELRILKEI